MAIFGWLQRFIKRLLTWIGILDTEDSSWDNLSTQYNLLKDEIDQSGYFTSSDKEIQSIPIDSFVLFPKYLWMGGNDRKFTVIDDVLYSSQQQARGWMDDTGFNLRVYRTDNMVSFYNVEYNSDSTNFLGRYGYAKGHSGLSQNGVKIIKFGDYYYNEYGRFGVNEDGTKNSAFYNTIYSTVVGQTWKCYAQALLGTQLIQLIWEDTHSSGLYINGTKSVVSVPYTFKNQYYTDGDIASYYNSLPSFGLHATSHRTGVSTSGTDIDEYTIYNKYDMEAGNYLYIMYGDILYQYDTSFDLQNIYHVPFANFGMFYMGGSLYFRTRTGAVKCVLT